LSLLRLELIILISFSDVMQAWAQLVPVSRLGHWALGHWDQYKIQKLQ
jgi:hypothetical protein